MARKRRNRGNRWQLVGLAVLALITLGVVAYAMAPTPAPAPVAMPTVGPSASSPAAPAPTTVAFVGDSYTAGAGSTSGSWADRISHVGVSLLRG